MSIDVVKAMERIDKLSAEIERLRAALLDCMKHVPAHVEERYRELIK